MTTTLQCTFDAADPHRLAEFWAAALDYEIEDNDEWCRRMVAEGHATDADVEEVGGRMRWRDGTALHDRDVTRPRIYIQRVPESKSAKNRLHFDLRVGADGRDAEVERLVSLGGQRVGDGSQGSHRWAVMADPEGNEFCVS